MREQLKTTIRTLLARDHLRMTPAAIVRALHSRFPNAGRAQIRAAIKEMVAARELLYTHHFSITHLELNLAQSLRVSHRIVLNMGTNQYSAMNGVANIRILGGGAFGSGDHPTTRLSMQGVDVATALLATEWGIRDGMVLDVGTGSGVLAIAAVLLGARRAIGLDIDPVACHEALGNVRRNGLQDCVAIVAGSLEAVAGSKFNLVIANLRPPTLIALMPQLEAVSKERAVWVLSGFRPDEWEGIKRRFSMGLRVVHEKMEHNWAAKVVLRDASGCEGIGLGV